MTEATWNLAIGQSHNKHKEQNQKENVPFEAEHPVCNCYNDADKSNQGQGAARNRGLEKAVGEFIYFMDSDDILEKDCLATCYNYCCESKLDYVVFDEKVICDYNQEIHLPKYERNRRIYSSIIWNSSTLLVYLLENNSVAKNRLIY